MTDKEKKAGNKISNAFDDLSEEEAESEMEEGGEDELEEQDES